MGGHTNSNLKRRSSAYSELDFSNREAADERSSGLETSEFAVACSDSALHSHFGLQGRKPARYLIVFTGSSVGDFHCGVKPSLLGSLVTDRGGGYTKWGLAYQSVLTG
jgi:hypothetical protein